MTFTPRTKTILLVLIILGSAALIGLLLYILFFSSPKSSPESEPTTIEGQNGILPSSQEGKPQTTTQTGTGVLKEADRVARGGITLTTTLTTTPVGTEGIIANEKGVRYYDPEDGRFYSVDAAGTTRRLSEATFPSAESFSWNKNGEKAVIEFPDGSNIIYNFDTGTQVTLPEHWEDFHFSPSEDEIVAKSIGLDPRNRSIVISSDTGSNVKAIQDLGDNADKVFLAPSPHDQIVGFSDTGETQPGIGRRMLIPLGKNHENFKGLIVEGLDFLPLWSPQGDYLLYSVAGETSEYAPLLWMVDGSTNTLGDNRHSLGLNTWADKCVFADNTNVYCAVPQNLPEKAGLQRSRSDGIPDSLYRVDLGTGRTSLIATTDVGASMRDLTLSPDQRTLYFVNSLTGLLQSLRLK